MANNGEIHCILWYDEIMDNTVGSLTKEEKSIIIGSVLGDGYLRIVPGRKNALFEINSSFKQKAYIDWKYEKIGRIVITPPKQRNGKGGRIAYRFSTRQHPDLTKIYRKFYQKKEKIVPKGLKLNPLIIAVWFMDDGSKCYTSYYFNTQGFTPFYQKRLLKILRNQYRIEGTLNKDKIYYRIRIRAESVPKLKEIINPYIIPTMRYKLGKTP